MRRPYPLALAALACLAAPVYAQGSTPVASPEVTADRKVTFRIRAPRATAVRLGSPDIRNIGDVGRMAKSDAGTWEVTVGPLVPGAYRYNFDVDGVAVLDPANPKTSESNTNSWSLSYVPGSPVFDTRDVPHGAVAEVTYSSTTLKRPRRMHVYTPPGYQKGSGKYPVFYLLHGAFDSDDSWSTVGRAGFILDNLIADGKAKPMIVVMPNGHTSPFTFGAPNALERQLSEFVDDFVTDVKPYVEKHYRVAGGRSNTAIAGLSMGGAQTLMTAIPRLEDYGYIGVYSSGIFGSSDALTRWAEQNKKTLEDPRLKKGLKLLWFATGKEDFLMPATQATVKALRDRGFTVELKETEGGHTWLNWRDYLAEFTPQLFR